MLVMMCVCVACTLCMLHFGKHSHTIKMVKLHAWYFDASFVKVKGIGGQRRSRSEHRVTG